LDDFKSHAELGKGRPSKVPQKSWESVSMNSTLAGALALQHDIPSLGDYVSRVAIPDEVERQQEGVEDPTHYEVWAPAAALLDRVVETTEIKGGVE
jgi:hypothetical protein